MMFQIRANEEYEFISLILNHQQKRLTVFYVAFIEAYKKHMEMYPSGRYTTEYKDGFFWKIPLRTLHKEINEALPPTIKEFTQRQTAQFINFLCAMHLLVKVRKRKGKAPQAYKIPILTDEYIQRWSDRYQQLYKKRTLHMNMSSKTVENADIAGLLDDTYPEYNLTNKKSVRALQAQEFEQMVSIIDSRLATDGYCTRETLQSDWMRTRPMDRAGILRPDRYFHQFWADRKGDLLKRYRYTSPTKGQMKTYQLTNKKYIFLPASPSAPETIQALMEEPEDIRQLSDSRIGRWMDIKDSLYLSESGRLFRMSPLGKALELKPTMRSKRPHYDIYFREHERKVIAKYKLIALAFGQLWNYSPQALRMIEQSADSWKAFCSLHVHHIDGNRDNNQIENLQLLTKEEHEELHRSPPAAEAG